MVGARLDDVLAVSHLAAHLQTAGRRLTVRRETAVTCVARLGAATALTLVFEVSFEGANT